jgi:hypothetical protein
MTKMFGTLKDYIILLPYKPHHEKGPLQRRVVNKKKGAKP